MVAPAARKGQRGTVHAMVSRGGRADKHEQERSHATTPRRCRGKDAQEVQAVQRQGGGCRQLDTNTARQVTDEIVRDARGTMERGA